MIKGFLFYLLTDCISFKQCRQAKVSYTGSLHMDVCFQWNGGVVIREKVNFGEFPIMLRVSFFLSFFLSSSLNFMFYQEYLTLV